MSKGLKIFRTSNILRLPGIFRKDYVPADDMFDSKLMNDINDDYADEVVYDKIPIEFISLDTFILKTNLLCWNCDRSFVNRPVFAPTATKEADDGGIIFSVTGNFCSFKIGRAHV